MGNKMEHAPTNISRAVASVPINDVFAFTVRVLIGLMLPLTVIPLLILLFGNHCPSVNTLLVMFPLRDAKAYVR